MDRQTMLARVAREINRLDMAASLLEMLPDVEGRINDMVRVAENSETVIIPVDTDRMFSRPVGWLESEDVSIVNASGGKVGALLYTPADTINSRAFGERGANDPYYYTMRGMKWEIVGWTQGTNDIRVKMQYWRKLPVLANDTSTNWLLDAKPQVYRAALKAFAYTELEEEGRADKALQECAAEIAAMNDRYVASKVGPGPLIMQAPPRRLGGRHS